MTQVTGSHSVEPTRPADGREVGIAALAPPRAACGPSCLCLGGNGIRGWECGGGGRRGLGAVLGGPPAFRQDAPSPDRAFVGCSFARGGISSAYIVIT